MPKSKRTRAPAPKSTPYTQLSRTPSPEPPAQGRPWTDAEDDALLLGVQKCGMHWQQVAKGMTHFGRSQAMCRNRYQRITAREKNPHMVCKNRCKKCGQIKRGHTCRALTGGNGVERTPVRTLALQTASENPASAHVAPESPEPNHGPTNFLLPPVSDQAFQVVPSDVAKCVRANGGAFAAPGLYPSGSKDTAMFGTLMLTAGDDTDVEGNDDPLLPVVRRADSESAVLTPSSFLKGAMLAPSAIRTAAAPASPGLGAQLPPAVAPSHSFDLGGRLSGDGGMLREPAFGQLPAEEANIPLPLDLVGDDNRAPPVPSLSWSRAPSFSIFGY